MNPENFLFPKEKQKVNIAEKKKDGGVEKGRKMVWEEEYGNVYTVRGEVIQNSEREGRGTWEIELE